MKTVGTVGSRLHLSALQAGETELLMDQGNTCVTTMLGGRLSVHETFLPHLLPHLQQPQP